MAMRFLTDPDRPPAVALEIDGQTSEGGRLEATFEHFVVFQGLDVGGDRLSLVRHSPDSGAFAFSGDLKQVVVRRLDPRQDPRLG